MICAFVRANGQSFTEDLDPLKHAVYRVPDPLPQLSCSLEEIDQLPDVTITFSTFVRQRIAIRKGEYVDSTFVYTEIEGHAIAHPDEVQLGVGYGSVSPQRRLKP